MRRSMWVRQLAVVTALGLVAAACGNGEEADELVEEDEEEEVEEEEEEVEEPEEEPEEDEEAAEGDEGALNLGYVLPESGDLAFLGPPQIEAATLAVQDMNDAGGVLGEEVTLASGDEAGDTTLASEAAQQHINDGVDAIIGAAASGMSLAFVDAVTDAGVLQCSGSNTAPTFTDGDYNGLYFRTAPTDALQGPVLAEAIVGDGNTNPAIMARADDYGQGLMDATVAELEAQGATVAAEITYDPDAANFDAEVGQAADSGADSVAIIAFDEGAQILATMVEQGLSTAEIPIYGADGMRSNDLAELVDPGDPSVIEGLRGTSPGGADVSTDFLDRYQEETGLDDTTFAAEVYDCGILIGLAAELAGSTAAEDIAANMVEVTAGDTECSSFEECRDLIADGESVAYQTASGVVLTTTDTGNGEPESGSYEVWEVDGEGAVSTTDVVVSSF